MELGVSWKCGYFMFGCNSDKPIFKIIKESLELLVLIKSYGDESRRDVVFVWSAVSQNLFCAALLTNKGVGLPSRKV